MKFQDTKRDRLEIREGERWTEKKERVSEIHIYVDREIDRVIEVSEILCLIYHNLITSL